MVVAAQLLWHVAADELYLIISTPIFVTIELDVAVRRVNDAAGRFVPPRSSCVVPRSVKVWLSRCSEGCSRCLEAGGFVSCATAADWASSVF